MPQSITKADSIKRVPVPEENRTPDKDEAARWIEQLWPTTMTEIAEQSGYSRQHIKNTLVDYFEIDEDSGGQDIPHTPDQGDLDLDSPVVKALLIGYRLGWRDRGDEESGGVSTGESIDSVIGELLSD